jgi:hypothetical protein
VQTLLIHQSRHLRLSPGRDQKRPKGVDVGDQSAKAVVDRGVPQLFDENR